MKKIITICLIVFGLAGLIFCSGATSTDVAYQTQKGTKDQAFTGLMATDPCSGTYNCTNLKIGSLYGKALTVEVIYTGTDANGFTVTISHKPDDVNGDVNFPSNITKFSETITAASGEYVFQSTDVDGNVFGGSIFTGDVYLTVAGFSGTAWWINVTTENGKK